MLCLEKSHQKSRSRYSWFLFCSVNYLTESLWHHVIHYWWQKLWAVFLLQVSTNCLQMIHYKVDLIPTISNQMITIRNSTSIGETSLILSSTDIQLNEFYETVVTIEGSSYQHHFYLSMQVPLPVIHCALIKLQWHVSLLYSVIVITHFIEPRWVVSSLQA